ncbi:MAG: peptidoglycan -binding protein [Rhodospirillaceae bacterium]|jgi:chemotaxis protein MotB|nr:peptidoglycan -binding protein [Rhodospirillaceae bacterium]MBT5667309.1 peptidoglycan -binding protein [Rhodospirillaceae bacterium]
MALARRNRNATNIWPGFVDALATLLMVIIFVLMIFVVSQFYLNDALQGRDEALDRLNHQVSELADLLSLERQVSSDLRSSVAQISGELQSSLSQRDDLSTQLSALLGVRDSLTESQKAMKDLEAKRKKAVAARADLVNELEQTYKSLEDANKTISVDKEKINLQLRQLANLQQDIAALTALREELTKKVEATEKKASKAETAVKSQRKISTAAKAQVALLNRQMLALREQIATLNATLEASEHKDRKQQAKIANLGKRLNSALASKVQELAKYRSEFFGRLRKVLGDRRDIQIVGDRFVFQSEVLFSSGSDQLETAGKAQLAQLASTLQEIAKDIPEKLNWILRVDGHTDRVPIHNLKFASNWELSTGRAISVVKFLQEQSIPANRLAAAGFGEHQPLDARDDEIAYRRNRRIELKLDQR